MNTINRILLAAARETSTTVGDIDIAVLDLGFKVPEISAVITFIIRALFAVAGLMALLYLLLGGISWVTSGGNKESVQKARDKIEAAVIGLIVVFAVLAVVVLLEKVLNTGLGVSKPIKFPQLIQDQKLI